jgi:two-component system, LuxR family, response regulator FixJ
VAAQSPRIYVVEDDEIVRDSLKALFEAHDCIVADFGSGLEFLSSRRDTDIDCLVLDIHMPEMTGLELLKELRNRGEQVPAILITGRSDAAAQVAAKALGAVALIDKPIAHPVLFDALKRALAARSI